jgi:hypothetical protein
MGAAASMMHRTLTVWLPGEAIILQIVRVGSAIAVAIGVLAVAAWLLRIREFTQGVALVTQRLR